jgi:DNA topoisomerase-1
MPYVKSKGGYVDSKGKRVSNRISDKIRKVYIPPGYKNVQYYLQKNLLATGVDSKGRTQYVYSNEHKQARTQKRAKTVLKVSKVITKLEKTIDRLVAKDERALVMKLIMTCHFRIGCESNAKAYKHYGVTTIRPKHVRFRSNKCTISFVGKKGVHNKGDVRCAKTIRALRRLVKAASRMDGNRIFSVRNHEANSILKPFGVTSKDLRTWYANVEFVKCALKKQPVRDALDCTAKLFHNTPAVLKSSYIVPKVYKHFKDNNGRKTSSKNPVKVLLKLI